MNILWIILAGVVAYLIGAIPTAVWYGQYFHTTDVRQYGSGNAGATNTFRVLGKKAGSIVLLIDAFKGWAAASLANLLLIQGFIMLENLLYFQLLYGIVAVLGHIFPVYVGFKGGKGVATLLGMVLAIYLQVALLSLAIFIIVLVVSHYVSLSSMTAALAFPLLMFIPFFRPENNTLILVGFILCGLVIWTHRRNIQRLLSGNEGKIYLF
ncbi:MAG: glycerol-3-phosphate 1-O-acyltransferase PlsY, partial [Bacteroidota bacterium]